MVRPLMFPTNCVKHLGLGLVLRRHVQCQSWRLWSKVCCGQKWLLLLYPIFLLFLMVSLMTMTLPLPLPPADTDQRLSRSLSSAGDFRTRPRVVEVLSTTGSPQPLSDIQHRAQSMRHSTSKHSAAPKPFRDTVGGDRNTIKDRHHAAVRRNKRKGIASKRKETTGANQHPNGRPSLPDFTVNNKGPKHRIKSGNHSAVGKHIVQAYIHLERRKSIAAHFPDPTHTSIKRQALGKHAGDREDGHTNRNADTQIHNKHTSKVLGGNYKEKYRQHPGKSDSQEQQAVKKLFRYLSKHHNPAEAKKNPVLFEHRKPLSEPDAALQKDDSSRCSRFMEDDFSDRDHRRIRVGPALTWLSEDDIWKMSLLAGGEVVSKAKLDAHGQVLQVALDHSAREQHGHNHRHADSHSERCQQGYCSLIKRTDDWFEVFAFHLDRVLGLNRSLPMVLRTFRSDILPYRYISGIPRPIVWWDPDIQHLANRDNDQNSVPLSWVQYQKLLRVHCGIERDQRSAPCVGIDHSEWGKLALFDFILQVNDRLDRYCCGFTPDPSELCVENLLNAKCGNTKDLLLVHILVRKTDPSRLVFIDNAGRPQHPTDNLNFRLVEGIDEFPERAVSVLQSGCLETLLLRSLYTDREFWDSGGGADGLRPLIRSVEHRGKILLQHIRDKKLQIKRDL